MSHTKLWILNNSIKVPYSSQEIDDGKKKFNSGRIYIVCILSCPNIFFDRIFSFFFLIANSSIVGHKHNHKLFFFFFFFHKKKSFFFLRTFFFLMRFSAFNDNLMILKHFNCVFKVKNNSKKYKLFYKMFVLCDF